MDCPWTFEQILQGARRLGKSQMVMFFAMPYLLGYLDRAGWPTRGETVEECG